MNRAITKGFKRIRQSAWCCGKNYQRWKFKNSYSDFPSNSPTHCIDCGQPLEFRKVTNPTLDRYNRNRLINLEAGRTCLGTKPRRKNFNIPTGLDKAWRAARAEMGQIAVPDISMAMSRLDR